MDGRFPAHGNLIAGGVSEKYWSKRQISGSNGQISGSNGASALCCCPDARCAHDHVLVCIQPGGYGPDGITDRSCGGYKTPTSLAWSASIDIELTESDETSPQGITTCTWIFPWPQTIFRRVQLVCIRRRSVRRKYAHGSAPARQESCDCNCVARLMQNCAVGAAAPHIDWADTTELHVEASTARNRA